MNTNKSTFGLVALAWLTLSIVTIFICGFWFQSLSNQAITQFLTIDYRMGYWAACVVMLVFTFISRWSCIGLCLLFQLVMWVV